MMKIMWYLDKNQKVFTNRNRDLVLNWNNAFCRPNFKQNIKSKNLSNK